MHQPATPLNKQDAVTPPDDHGIGVQPINRQSGSDFVRKIVSLIIVASAVIITLYVWGIIERHPRTDDALAVFVAGHRHVSFAQAASALPGSVHAATQRSDVRIREYAPLCLTAGPGRGRTSRGWARIDAGISMRRLAGRRQEVCAAQGHTTRIGTFWIALFP